MNAPVLSNEVENEMEQQAKNVSMVELEYDKVFIF